MLVTHSLALAIWPIRRFRIDGAMRRHCISGVEGENKPPSSRRDGQLHR
jgi:hypothetical protein